MKDNNSTFALSQQIRKVECIFSVEKLKIRSKKPQKLQKAGVNNVFRSKQTKKEVTSKIFIVFQVGRKVRLMF